MESHWIAINNNKTRIESSSFPSPPNLFVLLIKEWKEFLDRWTSMDVGLITKFSNRTINHQCSHRFYRFIFNVIAALDIKKNIKLDKKEDSIGIRMLQ